MSVWVTASRGRADGGDDADPGDEVGGELRGLDDREEAGQQVDAGGDHGRGVDERGDGRRALHGVGQPDVQRELGALADRPGGQPEGEQRQHRLAQDAEGDEFDDFGVDGGDVERAGAVPDQDQRGEQAEVAEARDDERLLGGGGGGGPVEPEADQEVGGRADQLPEDEQHEQVVGQDQAQHGGGEERHEGVVARDAAVALHVAERVDLDEQRDAGDDDEHDGREAVEAGADVDDQVAGAEQRRGS